jgi:hypothetical protein
VGGARPRRCPRPRARPGLPCQRLTSRACRHLHATITGAAPSGRGPGTGCPRMPRRERSSASSKARRSSRRGTNVRLPRRGEPRRRRHVTDLLRAQGADHRRERTDRRAPDESGELRTELGHHGRERRDGYDARLDQAFRTRGRSAEVPSTPAASVCLRTRARSQQGAGERHARRVAGLRRRSTQWRRAGLLGPPDRSRPIEPPPHPRRP